jgi:hypothetical protein
MTPNSGCMSFKGSDSLVELVKTMVPSDPMCVTHSRGSSVGSVPQRVFEG